MQKVFPAGGFVLVGGKSQRMGQDKALLELQGKPLLLRTVELLRPHVAQVTLLGPAEPYARFGVPVLPDRRPGGGPLAALCTALESSGYEWNVFLACDLPLLEEHFVEFLLERSFQGEAEAVVPETSDGWQPLCAAYRRRCLPPMQQALAEGTAGIVDILGALRVYALRLAELAEYGFSEETFKNVNTREDWEAVQRTVQVGRR